MPKGIPSRSVSRRDVFQAAGGFTLLTLLPDMAEACSSTALTFDQAARAKARPVFTALPYLQPGAASVLKDGDEAIVIAWQTNGVGGEYELTYDGRKATIDQRTLKGGDATESEKRLNYVADLTGLRLGRRYEYKVSWNGELILEGHFTTRKPRGQKIRFVAFGDNSYGDVSDRATAYNAYRAMPDFVMNTGDNVYEGGRDDEYARYFFPVYNADEAGPRIGAPLLRAVPFYTCIANHDVHGKDDNHHPCADFKKDQDALGYFTAMHLPGNGPVPPPFPTPIIGPEGPIATFKTVAGDRYPRQSNYSFDYGDAHFLVLDANVYVDPTNEALQRWIEADLSGTDAAWKFVVYHHPAFNVGHEHYAEQHMRALSPLFEKHGVDLCFHGHEHTYQRTKPFRFKPTDLSGAQEVGSGGRLVPGEFTVDRKFDGRTVTKPDGIIYVTTGAGGKHLYDAEMNGEPGSWLHDQDAKADYCEKVVTDRHSLTVIDLDAKSLTLRQIDEWGGEVDRVTVTKA
jgi:acid phosphatase type 7